MENKKETAVEWLIEQLKKRGYAGEFPPHLLFEQAKEVEKQQMIEFAEYVATYPDKNRNVNGEMLHSKSKYDGAERTIDLLEQYYNKTYGSEGIDAKDNCLAKPKQVCENCKIEISKWGCGCAKPKQETLEEAAEKLALEYQLGNTGKIDTEDAKEMLIEFAKWQAGKMYSEEDLKEIFNIAQMQKNYGDYKPYSFEEAMKIWFEQFKKQ